MGLAVRLLILGENLNLKKCNTSFFQHQKLSTIIMSMLEGHCYLQDTSWYRKNINGLKQAIAVRFCYTPECAAKKELFGMTLISKYKGHIQSIAESVITLRHFTFWSDTFGKS